MKQIIYKPHRLPPSSEESAETEEAEATAPTAMILNTGNEDKILAKIEKYERSLVVKAQDCEISL